ncbi:forkhead box protein I1c-like [Saccostrea echinata]|uniref:forkhead box protein I1c-like n=1 Tax=Saccostrea echinata TaxID=191078 RepID=UPI002A7F70C0|nr:forkhead box protein I1c-like [Saccostrea echinata]
MSSRGSTSPPYTMSSMIIYAIWSSPEKALTLPEICCTLESMFHLYDGNDRVWYDKVRNALSKYSHFIKMDHSRSARGKLWTVDLALVPLTSFRKQTTRKDSFSDWPNLLHQYLGVPEIELRGVVSTSATSASVQPSRVVTSGLSFGIDRILNMSPRSTKHSPSPIVSVPCEDFNTSCDSFCSVFDSTFEDSDILSRDSVHELSYSSIERCRGYSDVSSSQDVQDFGHSTRIHSDTSIVSLEVPCSPIEPELSQDDIFAGVDELQSMLEPDDVIDFAPSGDFGVVSPAESHSLSALESIMDFVIPTQCSGDLFSEFEPYLRDFSD